MACVPIVVARRRSGKMAVVDGQQRALASKYAGFVNIWALVFNSTGKKHEAELFIWLNAGRKEVTPFELFQSALDARDPEILGIQESLTQHGHQLVKSKPKWGRIGAIKAVIAAFQAIKRSGLDLELDLLESTWKGQKDAVSAEIFLGVAKLIERMESIGHPMDRARWKRIFGTKNRTAAQISHDVNTIYLQEKRRGASGYYRYKAAEDYLFKLYTRGMQI